MLELLGSCELYRHDKLQVAIMATGRRSIIYEIGKNTLLTPLPAVKLCPLTLDRGAAAAAAIDSFGGYSRARSERGLRFASDWVAIKRNGLLAGASIKSQQERVYLVGGSRA